MKQHVPSCLLALLACAVLSATNGAAAAADDWLAPYNVVWDTPSTNHHGSMPLGNGEVAVNAWVTDTGDLHFYISRTDAWDDYARLVKVGKVRVHLEPNPFAPGQPFRQTLDLRTATLKVEVGDANRRTQLQLWVDAHLPVIQVTVASAVPMDATAFVELWRTNRKDQAELQVSDVLTGRKSPDGRPPVMTLEPDTLLEDQRDRIGWYHHNTKSVGPRLLAEIQGLTGFKQTDPLLQRTFGAVVTAAGGERLENHRLRSPRGTAHRFSVFVRTQHPATPETWLAGMENVIRHVEAQDFAGRRAAHEQWWRAFWERSWIRATADPDAKREVKPAVRSLVPVNAHPVRLGQDQGGGNSFTGELGRVSLFNEALPEPDLRALAQGPRAPLDARRSLVYSGRNLGPVSDSAGWEFARGLTIEAWVKPAALPGGGARLVDKITPGGSDGFLLDTFPGNSLRFICGPTILQQADALPADAWAHVAAVVDPAGGGCRLYLNGQSVGAQPVPALRDAAAFVSQMYHLQRFVTACAGRGAFPIKFNGSLFTVPPGPTAADPDYRRWGPGYWWQNTRLPYLSLCASGDFDLQTSLFRMYAKDLLPLCQYRTRHYLGHDGAFYPECIMFWGAVFSETYGWTPFEQRTDKLQESGWHKWEWVGGLELAWMMLDYYDHTLDREFLRDTTLPFAHEILTFFDQHYPVNAQGQLVMHPSQALETWWRCTNAAPELAGCLAVTDRLLALPAELTAASERGFWERFRAKLPPVPLRDVNGRKALAPAAFFEQKSNIENPELYAVFPFRLFAFSRPNADRALEALKHRWDRGNSGWRQDDLFMAYLGLADDARQNLVDRARSHDPNERFPAFWGPNYDWTPDQDHGGVLMRTFQAMLLQSDAEKIFLLPAWPREWDVTFKLHAPRQTVVQGVSRRGTLESLEVTPEPRRADVVVCPAPISPLPR